MVRGTDRLEGKAGERTLQATLRAGAEAARRATGTRRAGAAATGIAAAAEEVSVKAIVSAGALTKCSSTRGQSRSQRCFK